MQSTLSDRDYSIRCWPLQLFISLESIKGDRPFTAAKQPIIWLIFQHYGRRFRAAVVAKPVINWTSFNLTADGPQYFSRYCFGAFPWQDQEQYWRRSPLSLVGNVTTSTMLLMGESDYRTPIGETEQFYLALKLQKEETAMVRVPEASHGIAGRPSNLIAKVVNILGWFELQRSD